MAADLPENYQQRMDAFQFIKDVAVDWDESRVLDAEPGDFIVMARKAKGKGDWFVGGITDENERSFTVNTDFLSKNKRYQVAIYRDADDAHWQNNPEAYKIEKQTISGSDNKSLTIKMAAGGGFAISFIEIK